MSDMKYQFGDTVYIVIDGQRLSATVMARDGDKYRVYVDEGQPREGHTPLVSFDEMEKGW